MRVGRSITSILILTLTLHLAPLSGVRKAHAETQVLDRNLKPLVVLGTFGLVGGAVAGLIATPFSSQVRSVFVGASAGLYLGIAIGFAYILTRDDPNHPLRNSSGSPHSLGAIGPELSLREIKNPQSESILYVDTALRAQWTVSRF